MPTLYVENVPEALYEAIRARAKNNRKSIAAEILELLAETVPTADELARRQEFGAWARSMRSGRAKTPGVFPATEEMQREDRNR